MLRPPAVLQTTIVRAMEEVYPLARLRHYTTFVYGTTLDCIAFEYSTVLALEYCATPEYCTVLEHCTVLEYCTTLDYCTTLEYALFLSTHYSWVLYRPLLNNAKRRELGLKIWIYSYWRHCTVVFKRFLGMGKNSPAPNCGSTEGERAQ